MTAADDSACRILYCTTASPAEAEQIGRTLVIERLAACVNLLPAMTSVYRWEGNIETAQEAVLLVKTTDSCTESTIRRIVELHSYDCPAVLTLPIEGGNPDYLHWLKAQVAPEPG